MLYYSRQFKRHMETKRAGRMTAIPQLDVPEILVDNEEQRAEEDAQQRWRQQQEQQQQQSPTAGRGRAKSSAAATALGSDSGSLLSPSTSRARSQHRSWAAGLGADLSSYDTSYGHPLAGPLASRPSPSHHRSQASAFSFELAEPGDGPGLDGDEALSLGGRGSNAVDPAVVRDMLDDSIWVESLRRSATTMRKSGWGSQGGFK